MNNTANIEYEKLFNTAKDGYLFKNKKAIFELDMRYKDISNKDVELMNYYNAIALEEFQKIISSGLCMPLSIFLIDIATVITKQQYAFLTFGRITTTIDNHDIFSVGTKKHFIDKYNNSRVVPSNMHAWITLSDGTIIDPSIEGSEGISDRLLIGSPMQLSKKYKYSPYLIADCVKTSEFGSKFDFDYYCQDKIKKIKANYSKS